MSRNVFVDMPNELIWPHKCAMCNSKNEKLLRLFGTSEEKQSGIAIPIPYFGAVFLSRTIKAKVIYPICKLCMENCKKLDFLSNRLPIFCLIAMAITFAVMLQSVGGYWAKGLYPVSWLFLIIELAIFVYCTIATKRVPVRINNLRKDSIELVFADDNYAKEFESLNQPYARYISTTKSVIGLKG